MKNLICGYNVSRNYFFYFSVILSLFFLISLPTYGQTPVDTNLLAEINKIQAIDNHAHPLCVVGKDQEDSESDVLPLDGLKSLSLPIRLNPGNPEYLGAWRSIYGYAHQDASEAHQQEFLALKFRLIAEKGDNYPSWVLQQIGIETMLSNRIAMGRGLTTPNFRWVSFVDPLLFPLNNNMARKENPDYDYFYPYEEKALKRYLSELKLSALPKDFDSYLKKVVTATLEQHKRNGAVAFKFEVALLRSLRFSDVPKAEAKQVYEKYIQGSLVDAASYKLLQDYIFYYIASEAGRLQIPVHMHIIAGPGGYYKIAESNPLNLEPVFNNPRLKNTNFVIIHGGWPFTKETGLLIQGKSNVYADCSAQTFLLYPKALSEILRNWLELAPDKVLFGTDSFAISPFNSWEENCWLTTTTARQALALALTGMINDGEINKEQALDLAKMFLRNNAIALYGFNSK
ncbi:MAG: amidohydrolase 2 [bacterium]|nr:MAG: amidohydrolase 2 [bacterium]